MPGTGCNQPAFGQELVSSDREIARGFVNWMQGGDTPMRTRKEQGWGQAAAMGLLGG